MAKTVELHFPSGGLNKALSYQQQAPYTSPSLMNVRTRDPFSGRERGGSRPGLARVNDSFLGDSVRLLSSVTYIPSGGVLTTIPVASATGDFFIETGGVFVSIGSSLTLASDYPIRSAERVQKLYIADYSDEPVATGTNGVVSGGGTTFDSASYADWTAVPGLNANDFVVVIGATGSRIPYRIASISTGAITLTDSAPTGTSLTFRIERALKFFDPSPSTLAILHASAGTVPVGCRLITRFRDRIILSGDPLSPNQVYACATGDPTDWNYGVVDTIVTGAWSLQTGESGLLGDPVTALVPHTDKCMIIGCTKSLHILRGDPRAGGGVDELSSRIGIVDAGAFCRSPSGWLFFLSSDGLYAMPPGCGDTPMSVSRDQIPEELLSLDRTTMFISMEWDIYDRGFHIFLTIDGGETAKNYFVNTDTERAAGPAARFFPCQYPHNCEPTAVYALDAAAIAGSKVYLGGRDGYVRRHDNAALDDDGYPICSSVMIGPFGASLSYDALLRELTAILSASSGEVEWSIQTANTFEGAVAGDPGWKGTWESGLNPKERPRARGAGICLTIRSTNPWALEQILVVIDRLGLTRL